MVASSSKILLLFAAKQKEFALETIEKATFSTLAFSIKSNLFAEYKMSRFPN